MSLQGVSVNHRCDMLVGFDFRLDSLSGHNLTTLALKLRFLGQACVTQATGQI